MPSLSDFKIFYDILSTYWNICLRRFTPAMGWIMATIVLRFQIFYSMIKALLLKYISVLYIYLSRFTFYCWFSKPTFRSQVLSSRFIHWGWVENKFSFTSSQLTSSVFFFIFPFVRVCFYSNFSHLFFFLWDYYLAVGSRHTRYSTWGCRLNQFHF